MNKYQERQVITYVATPFYNRRKTMLQDQMINQLCLWGIQKTLEIRLKEASEGGWKYSEFLEAIFQDEIHFRNQKKTEQRIKRAKFRQLAHEDLYDFSFKRNLTKAQVKELMGLFFIEKKQSLLLTGPTGVGKTFLASAIGNHACHKGVETIFLSINNFIEQTEVARTTGKYLRFKEKLIKCGLLILDDFGLSKMTAQNLQDFYDILEERYQQRSTVITGQVELEAWKDIITDKIMLEAIVDRFAHGLRIEMKGDTYRKKQGLDKVMGARGN